jgi:Uri superfamily endonuclease
MGPNMTPIGILDRFGREFAAAGVSGLWVTPDGIGKMPTFGGAYVLVLRLDRAIRIEFPRVTCDQLMPGWYVYLGSAKGSGGIRARIKRHFQCEKTAHWHIDRLTVHAVEMAALAVADGHECELLGKLLKSLKFKVAVAGFGSTDCRLCESHLLTIN